MNEIKKKFTVNISIAVLLVAIFVYIGTEYLVRDIETYSSQIVQDEQAVFLQRSKNTQLPDLKRRYEEITAMMTAAFDSLVGKEETVTFIQEAEKTAVRDKVKLTIKDLGAGQPKEAEPSNSLIATAGFNFQVGGTFNNVMHFLGEMENFKYCSEIENVHMSYGDFDKYNTDMVVLTFNVKLYQENSQE